MAYKPVGADEDGVFPPRVVTNLGATYGTNTVLASIDRFPTIDPTGAANSSAAIQAAIDAVPDGGTVIIPAGTYAIGTKVSKSGKNLTIQAYGATFTKTVNDVAFDFTGGYDTPIAVTSLGVATITDDTTGSDTGTAITVGTAPTGWVKGDVVKVYADDVIPGGRPGSGGLEARVGQFLVVSNVTGSVINCLGTLDDPYTTNIRVARLQNKAVHIRGGEYVTDASILSIVSTTNMFQFRSMANPTVRDARIKSTSYAGFRFTGCYGYTVDSCDVDYAKNDATNLVFGYGIQDASSSYGTVTNYRARRVRHAYTDGSAFIAAATADPMNYGRTYGTRISNSIAYGTSNTAWDTHSWSQNVTFSDVQAINCYKCIDFRGRYHKAIDCAAIKCGTGGVYIANESDGGDSFGHYVKDFYAEDTPRVIEAYVNQTGHPLVGVRETRQSIIDGILIKNGANEAIYIRNSTVRIDNIKHVANGTIVSGDHLMLVRNSVVEGDRWVQDARGLAGGSGGSLVLLELASELKVGRWAYTTSSANAGFIGKGIDTSDSASIAQVGMLTMSHPIASPVASGLAATSFVDWESLSDGQNSGWIAASDALIASATGPVLGLARTREREVTLRLTANGGAQELAPFQAGFKRGQKVIIWNISTSNAVTVKNATANKTQLIGSVDKVLASQESLTLTWNNSTWWQRPLDKQ